MHMQGLVLTCVENALELYTDVQLLAILYILNAVSISLKPAHNVKVTLLFHG